MMPTSHAGVPASPMRLMEMLTDRFGVFEALAHSTIKLNRCTSADEFAMDPQVAEAVLEFADDLRTARAASGAWAETWMADAGGWIFWYNERWHQYTGTTLEE